MAIKHRGSETHLKAMAAEMLGVVSREGAWWGPSHSLLRYGLPLSQLPAKEILNAAFAWRLLFVSVKAKILFG